MDQKKVGAFIAKRRKTVGLTQMQLAEKLCITDRAVSKWETGKALPDASIMLELCKILEISVNELLTGEEVSMEDYNKRADDNLIEMVKQKEQSDKRLLSFEIVIGILSMIILLGFCFIASLLPMEDWQRIVLIVSGMLIGLIGLFFALRIEQVAGYYECQCCHHKYVPKYSAALFAMHVGRTRYMKCPKCGKWSWQKKTISKE